MRLVALTFLCLTVFASNSIYCRGALIWFDMGPLEYTGIRSLSAALMLALLCLFRLIRPATPGRSVWRDAWEQSSWAGALSLFGYMICFSLGYVGIPSAPGTLILNMCVQFFMLGWGMLHGIWPGRRQNIGFFIATVGLLALVSPGLTAPPLLSSLLMALAGFSWGLFTVVGRDAHSAALAMCGNFWRTALLGLICFAAGLLWESPARPAAWVLALVSGGLATSLSYILWYAIVPLWSLVASSLIQLAVPIITAVLGVIFLSEPITLRLVLSAALILGGIALAICSRRH